VLYSGDIARMITFEVYIDSKFVYRQRSDGIITASPTGSTAYALSCNGPILHPSLNAIVLVPLNPHTLSSRPIVINSDVNIEYLITSDNTFNPRLSCDGQVHFNTMPGDRIVIKSYPNALRLIHPKGYDYFHMLRDKLGWGTERTKT
jgi:NAD+ kinase